MAAIMALSPVSAFASTSNRMDGTLTTAKKKTVLMERTWMNGTSSSGRNVYSLEDGKVSNEDIKFVVQGSDLIIAASTDQLKAGDTFEITLTNAEWAFANDNGSGGSVLTPQTNSITPTTTNYYTNLALVYNKLVTVYTNTTAKLPTGSTLITGTNIASILNLGSTWDDATSTAVPGPNASVPNTPLGNYADAMRIYEQAQQIVERAYNQVGEPVITDTLVNELTKHSNTRYYETGFSPLVAGRNSDTEPYKFASGALSKIYTDVTSGASQADFNRSTFDKSLGSYTSIDAGAYLRYGTLPTPNAGTQPVLAYDEGTNKELSAVLDGLSLSIAKPAGGWAGSAGAQDIAGGDWSQPDYANANLLTQELPYMMRFTGTSDRKIATVTVLRSSGLSAANVNNASYLRIPMVIRMLNDGNATINVAPSVNGTVTGVSYTIGSAGGSGTTTTVDEVKTSRNTFELGTIKIEEKAIGTLSNGIFHLTAPYGYTWADPSKTDYDILMSTSGGIRYARNDGTTPTRISRANGVVVNYALDSKGNKITNKLEFDLRGGSLSEYGIDQFDTIRGSIYIEDLVLLAEDYAPFDKDVMVKITSGTPDPNIDEQEVKVAVRKDWIISLTASSPVPTLVNGRFAYELDSNGKYEYTLQDDLDGWHKTSKVTFKENVEASWWEERDTELTLPEGVKYIQVKIADASATDEFDFKNGLALNGEYKAYELEGKRQGYVKISGNKLTLTDLTLRAGKKADFTIQPWVSIESGFEGDITMTAGGTGVPYEVAPVVIAKAVSPITIDTQVTDVKIGYQWQKVADFTINETGAGRLLKDKTIRMSIDDAISSDEIAFAPDSVVEKSGNISFTKPSVQGGSIELSIDRESNGTASSIKFTNVYVKIDRTVPESNNHPYKLLAEGNAIAANYVGLFKNGKTNYSAYEPVFSTRGIGADYLNVVTAATDKPGVLSNTVKVTIGSDVVLVGRDNPTEIQMDTAAYISAESNSTMVPVRFVSVALGIPEGQIQWDEENRTVTINYTNTTVQMKAGSDQLTINGVTTTMYSPDVPPKKVTVEMKDNRSFLPFRQLGYALGVPVDWDDETRTAIYNAPESLSASSSVTSGTAE